MVTLTEHRPVRRPVVYGYLRLAGVSLTRGTVLAVALADYCRSHELRLSGLFTERGGPASGSPAFSGLLDVLDLPGAYGVVLPNAFHLGPRSTAAEHERQIRKTGARLLMVRPHHRTPVAGIPN
ncbi:hypothetical protein [Streptomyces sp. NPDC046985]|uniref:hypothetical protein n=1 Tax=Streptomyces sp. NPDC046985 TaxID=3155377 RepID=UPI0033DE5037